MTYFKKHLQILEKELKELEDLNIKCESKKTALSWIASIPKQEFLMFKNSILFDPETGKFKEGTTIELLSQVYKANHSFSNLLLKHILWTEQSFKTKLAYLIYEKYGSQTSPKVNLNSISDYLSSDNYSSKKTKGRPRRTSVLITLREKILKEKKSVDPFTLVNKLNFGEAINWFYILKREDKLYIAYQLGALLLFVNDEDLVNFVTSSLKTLRKCRNHLAHGNHSPFLNISMGLLRKILGKSRVMDSLTIDKNYYFIISLILFIYNDIDYYSFSSELNDLLKKYQNLSLPPGISIYDIFGIPEDYLKRFETLGLYFMDKTMKNYSELVKSEDSHSKEKLQLLHLLTSTVEKMKN